MGKCRYKEEEIMSRLKEGRELYNEDIIQFINDKNTEIERLGKVQVQYVKAYFDEFVERLKKDLTMTYCYTEDLNEVIDELVETMKNEFTEFEDFTELLTNSALHKFVNKLKETPNNAIYKYEIDKILKETIGDNK